MITEAEQKDLEKIAESEPLVGKLLSFYNHVYGSTTYETLLTVRNQIKDFNEQLTIDPDKKVKRIINEGKENEEVIEAVKGRLDLFGSKDDKEFERGFKYLTEAVDLDDVCDKLMAKLSPKELESLEKKKKISKNTMVAA